MDKLSGNAGNDYLDGGSGADVIDGMSESSWQKIYEELKKKWNGYTYH